MYQCILFTLRLIPQSIGIITHVHNTPTLHSSNSSAALTFAAGGAVALAAVPLRKRYPPGPRPILGDAQEANWVVVVAPVHGLFFAGHGAHPVRLVPVLKIKERFRWIWK